MIGFYKVVLFHIIPLIYIINVILIFYIKINVLKTKSQTLHRSIFKFLYNIQFFIIITQKKANKRYCFLNVNLIYSMMIRNQNQCRYHSSTICFSQIFLVGTLNMPIQGTVYSRNQPTFSELKQIHLPNSPDKYA